MPPAGYFGRTIYRKMEVAMSTTVQRDVTVAERTAQALDFLAHSEAEFAAGDTRQGAEKLYGAAVQAVVAASHQRGWEYRSHRANKNATTRLAHEYNDPFLAAGFTAAQRLHIHFHHGDMEDYELAADCPAVRDYVNRMVTLIREYETNRALLE